MKTIGFFLALLTCQLSYGQDSEENRDLVFDSVDMKIIKRADAILSDSLKWNKKDDRECADDIATGNYSLYCATIYMCTNASEFREIKFYHFWATAVLPFYRIKFIYNKIKN